MTSLDSDPPALSTPSDRLHDLDALRGFAMLLGIVLHAAMSFIPGADLDVRNGDGVRPDDLLSLDWGTTAFIAQLFQLPIVKDTIS